MKRIVVLLLFVTACGGGSAHRAADPKSGYLHQAEAICVTANNALKQAKTQLPTSTAAVPPYVHRLVDIARQDVAALSALTPPPRDAADLHSKLIAPLTAQLADADAFAAKVDAAAAAKDNAKLTALVLNPPTKTRVDLAWMRTYGFSACVTAADTAAAAK